MKTWGLCSTRAEAQVDTSDQKSFTYVEVAQEIDAIGTTDAESTSESSLPADEGPRLSADFSFAQLSEKEASILLDELTNQLGLDMTLPQISDIGLMRVYDLCLRTLNDHLCDRHCKIAAQYIGLIESWMLCCTVWSLRNRGIVSSLEVISHVVGLLERIRNFQTRLQELFQQLLSEKVSSELDQLVEAMQHLMSPLNGNESFIGWLLFSSL